MKLPEAFDAPTPDFRRLSTLGVALSALVLLTPFSVNNFIQGHALLGAGSVLIIALLALYAWGILRGIYHPVLTFLTLGPAIIFFLNLSISTQGIIGILWCYPAVIAFCFIFPERAAWVAIGILLAVVIYHSLQVVPFPVAVRVVVSLLAVSIFSTVFVRVITKQQRKLEVLATTDALTGLGNRTLLTKTLEQAVEQCRRSDTGLTVVAIDIDDFKNINDTYGHATGDRILRAVGDLLLKRVRRSDYTFRMGGEEFLVVLTNTGAEDGRRVAEELRCAIEGSSFLPDERLTASMGVATLRPDEDWSTLVKRSDENLYVAKSGGRNRVVG